MTDNANTTGYVNASNRPYTKKLPDLARLDKNVRYLRLAALYIHDINLLEHYKYLKRLNISFTYVKSLPPMSQLTELQMMEVELDDWNDLAKCPDLKLLKMTSDDIVLTKPLPKLEVLHCAVICRPDLLHERFPD